MAVTAVTTNPAVTPPAAADTASLVDGTCRVTPSSREWENLGQFHGQFGEFFRNLKQTIRQQVPAAREDFERFDELLRQAGNPVEPAIRQELNQVFAQISVKMQKDGFKTREALLAVPQLFQTYRPYQPLRPITAAEAALISGNEQRFAQLMPTTELRRQLEQFVTTYDKYTSEASPRLAQLMSSTSPDLRDAAIDLRDADWSRLANDYAIAAGACQAEFVAAGQAGSPAAEATQAAPQLAVPKLSNSTLEKAFLGGKDTAVNPPISPVKLGLGNSSDFSEDTIIWAAAGLITLLAMGLPQLRQLIASGALAPLVPGIHPGR